MRKAYTGIFSISIETSPTRGRFSRQGAGGGRKASTKL